MFTARAGLQSWTSFSFHPHHFLKVDGNIGWSNRFQGPPSLGLVVVRALFPQVRVSLSVSLSPRSFLYSPEVWQEYWASQLQSSVVIRRTGPEYAFIQAQHFTWTDPVSYWTSVLLSVKRRCQQYVVIGSLWRLFDQLYKRAFLVVIIHGRFSCFRFYSMLR